MSLNFSYLALGDSYTIGEGVPLYQSYPYQAVQLLRSWGQTFHAPEIIARSGWTTSELNFHIEHTILNTVYDYIIEKSTFIFFEFSDKFINFVFPKNK